MLSRLNNILKLTKEIENLEKERGEAFKGKNYRRQKVICSRLEKARIEKHTQILCIEKEVEKLPRELKWIVKERFFKGIEWVVLYELMGVPEELMDCMDDKIIKKKVDVFSKKILRKLEKF